MRKTVNTNRVLLEGEFARKFHSSFIGSAPDKDCDVYQKLLHRYVSASHAPPKFWSTLLLWDSVVTYGPGVASAAYGNYQHISPFSFSVVNETSAALSCNKAEGTFREGSVGHELIKPGLLTKALRKNYTRSNVFLLSKSYTKDLYRPPEWHFLDLSAQRLKSLMATVFESGHSLLQRAPEVDGASWCQLRDTLAGKLMQWARKGEIGYAGRAFREVNLVGCRELALSLMGELHETYYYLDGLLTPWRLGADMISTTLLELRVSAMGRRRDVGKDSLVAANLYLADIYWPEPSSRSEFMDLVDDPDVVELRWNFHQWRTRALGGQIVKAQRSEAALRLAAKSIRKVRRIRKYQRINTYVAGVAGNLPFTSPLFTGITLLLEHYETQELELLGAMGVKIV